MHSTQTKNKDNNVNTEKKDKKTKNKNNNKNHHKFLLCCRPDVMDGLMEPGGEKAGGCCGRGEPVLKYVKMGHKDGVVFPKVLQALPSQKEETIDCPIKKKSHRSFSLVLKAVLFETSLAKKIKRKKRTQKLLQSNGNLLAKVAKDSKSLKGNTVNSVHPEFAKKDEGRKVANTQSSRSLSNLPSARSSLSRSNSIGSKQKRDIMQQQDGKGCLSSHTGFYLLLVTLFVLVCWGKVCAILCTSIWLFFAPRWNSGEISLQNGLYFQKFDSGEYRKKIIMEGLLKRSHNRGL